MATVNIDSNKNSNKDIERLLKEVAQLKMPDFEGFLKRAFKILEKRKSPEYKKKEKELIDKIKNGGPSKEIMERQRVLLKKSVQGIMTIQENKEALALIPVFDNWNLKRMKLLIELAELRDTSVQEVMKNLKLTLPEIVYA